MQTLPSLFDMKGLMQNASEENVTFFIPQTNRKMRIIFIFKCRKIKLKIQSRKKVMNILY